MTTNISIYLFDAVEVLDFAGPFEVFSTAARLHAKVNRAAAPLFNVHAIADELRTIRMRGGLKVQPDYSLSAHPPVELLIVPGGDVTRELERRDVIEWIGRTAQSATITASVCTGAFLLASAGLLDGLRVTTHWEDADELQRTYPKVTVDAQARFVDAGNIVTSAGISAGIDMCLHLLARLVGSEFAAATARQMDYGFVSATHQTTFDVPATR